MKLEGIGEEALGIPLNELRRVSELPDDVEIVEILPSPPGYGMSAYPREWVCWPDRVEQRVYLRIRHRYCVRIMPGTVFQITTLEEFLERYRNLAQMGR